MVKFLRGLVLLVLVLTVAALPAAAGTPSDAEITDPCGDLPPLVRAGNNQLTYQETRATGFDVASAWFSDLRDSATGPNAGLRVTLRVCGDVPAPQLQGSGWTVTWAAPQFNTANRDCAATTALEDLLVEGGVEIRRSARLSVMCQQPSTDELGRPTVTASTLFEVPLTAQQFAVDGGEITWTLRRDALEGDGAQVIAPGTVVGLPRAATRDGRHFIGGGQGDIWVRPGATDSTEAGRNYLIAD